MNGAAARSLTQLWVPSRTPTAWLPGHRTDRVIAR
jgi:hypothetical protein